MLFLENNFTINEGEYKMGKTFIPIMIRDENNLDFDETLKRLKEAEADRVYIAIEGRVDFERTEKRQKLMEVIKDYDTKLKANGFETGVWMCTLGFGGKISKENINAASGFARRTSISGNSLGDSYCPYDENFTDSMCGIVEDIARTGVDMIMLDDELCQSVVPGIGCACDKHLDEYRRRLGEDIKREDIKNLAFTGGKNKYRDTWLELMGDTLKGFCRALRERVDSVNPKVRMGFCAGFTSWDFEGVDAIELTKTLAGNTKPFLRFTGAPYWYCFHRFDMQPLQNIIESVRQQYIWSKDSGVEVFTEDDSYPRNRYVVPASIMELFDVATKVSDDLDALKYIIDYTSEPWYESGYFNAHIENLPLYKEIADTFNDKKAIGVRIYEEQRTIQNADLPDTFTEEQSILGRWFMQSSLVPTVNAIPTCYEGEGYFGMAFGEHAKYLPESAFNKGLVLDIKAAEILQKKGIDTGFISKKNTEYLPTEYFYEYKTAVPACCYSNTHDIEIKDNATVLSVYRHDGKKTPASYIYENDNGQRFMVFAFSVENILPRSSDLLSYARGQQLVDYAKWLGGEELPATCIGHPMLYSIAKEDDRTKAFAYFNCHADEVKNAKIKLSFKAKNVKFINCIGRYEDNYVIIDYIKPYGFAAFTTEV